MSNRGSAALLLGTVCAFGCAEGPLIQGPPFEILLFVSETPEVVIRDTRKTGDGPPLVFTIARTLIGATAGAVQAADPACKELPRDGHNNRLAEPCRLGIVVGAVLGAVRTLQQPYSNYVYVSSTPATPDLQSNSRVVNLPKLLTDALVSEVPADGRHKIALRPGLFQTLTSDSRILSVDIREIALTVSESDVDGADLARLSVLVRTSARDIPFFYNGSTHSIADWTANDAQLFRDELRSGMREIATDLVGEIRRFDRMVGELPTKRGEDFVNCVSAGERRWTYRSKCDP